MKSKINSIVDAHFVPFIRFGTVGGLTAVIYFSVMWVASSLLHFGYIIAVTVAYVCSTVFHFFANRHFTFKALDEGRGTQVTRYMAMWALNYLITIAVVHLCVKKLALSPYIGLCASIALTMLSGYLISRYWVFKNRSGK